MTPTESIKNDLSANLQAVRTRIDAAARRSGREPEEITLIAVSKTHPVETLRNALAAGATDLGENRVQEAEMKVAELGRTAARWHLIGNLQANKARKAVKVFDVIHTLDNLDLAQRLERICAEENRASLDVFAQVDLAGEITKSGAAPTDLSAIIEFLRTCRHLKLRGLMIIPPFFDDAESVRPYFRQLRELRDEWQAKEAFGAEPGGLSMGMSHDFEIAVEEGATLIRVGTMIFGARG